MLKKERYERVRRLGEIRAHAGISDVVYHRETNTEFTLAIAKEKFFSQLVFYFNFYFK